MRFPLPVKSLCSNMNLGVSAVLPSSAHLTARALSRSDHGLEADIVMATAIGVMINGVDGDEKRTSD